MKNSWKNITKEDVVKAIALFDDGNYKFSSPKNTFLVFNGKKYPAKFIRKMAYEVAFDEEVSLNDFSGGTETERFFIKLGFEIQRVGEIKYENHLKQDADKQRGVTINKVREATANREKKVNLHVSHQKNALQIILQKKLGLMETEKKLDCIKVPSLSNLPLEYEEIYSNLLQYSNEGKIREGLLLPCDIYHEKHKLIVEYDERQHFTLPRRITLENYPDSIRLNFPRRDWIEQCININAKDGNPPGRDNIRAFYDCVRDVEAAKNGFRLVRIKHGDFDWENYDENNKVHADYLDNLLNYTDSHQGINYDWRSLEIEFQRIKLNYLKWLFYLTPPSDNIIGCGVGDNFSLFNSPNGRSFSCSPSSMKSVYCGGGKGSVRTGNYFNNCEELERESSKIKVSLVSKTKELRLLLRGCMRLGDCRAVSEIIENYYWIKVGLHEFVHDNRFDFEKKGVISEGSRDYILERLSRNEEVDFLSSMKMVPFQWNRHACCAYDCGPIVLGINGYVPYSKVVEQRNEYFSDKIDIFKEANQDMKRDIATDSLSKIYDFLLLYHRDPIAKIKNYGDFKVYKDLLREEIIRIQNRINQIIDQEGVDLEKFYFVP